MPPLDISTATSSSNDATANPNSYTPGLRDAPPPFDKSSANLIIRSSDDVDFRVLQQAIIKEASSVFADIDRKQEAAKEQRTRCLYVGQSSCILCW